MSWWLGLVIVWSLLALVGGFALGARIDRADRRERGMRRQTR